MLSASLLEKARGWVQRSWQCPAHVIATPFRRIKCSRHQNSPSSPPEIIRYRTRAAGRTVKRGQRISDDCKSQTVTHRYIIHIPPLLISRRGSPERESAGVFLRTFGKQSEKCERKNRRHTISLVHVRETSERDLWHMYHRPLTT